MLHWFSSVCVFLGSWLSGYFIIATDAWMQYPVGYRIGPDGAIALSSLWDLLTNPWILGQYPHNMLAAVATGSFVMSAAGAFYILTKNGAAFGRTFVRFGVIGGTVATILLAVPTGDQQGKMVALHQPITLAAMEGLFDAEKGAPLALIGQPDTDRGRLDNPIQIPRMLSFLTYQRWHAEIKGLNDFSRDQWPDNIALLYFSYHIMVGLGTILMAIAALSALLLTLGKLYANQAMLWVLMLAFPFPYIATTAGWISAEVGRQPWLIYGLLRTANGTSPQVSAGSGMFTLLGFMGLYLLLGVLFLFLIGREVERGPEGA